jgi:hypothetical protein
MATRRSTRAQVEEAEPVEVEEEGLPEAEPVEDAGVGVGQGALSVQPTPNDQTLYIWVSPGSLLVKEGTCPEYKVGGDVLAGRVINAGIDDADQFYMGLPILYNARKAPQMLRAGVAYAVVRTEDVLGVASFDHTLMPNHVAAQRGPDREPYRLDDEVLTYRGSSSQTSSPSGSQGSTFASASPFEAFTGGSGGG